MYSIMNQRIAKSAWPNGYKMNGCKAVGVMMADIVDVDSFEIVYTGTIESCRGRIEIM